MFISWSHVVMERNLVSDSNVLKHLDFFRENKKARITSGLFRIFFFFAKHFAEWENGKKMGKKMGERSSTREKNHRALKREVEVIFFSLPLSSAKNRAFLGC